MKKLDICFGALLALRGEVCRLGIGSQDQTIKDSSLLSVRLYSYFKGCGRYAGGQGYNSIGHFCGGWAGNCGDGGIGGSTWYLVCDRCREKYLREKQAAAREKVGVFCPGCTANDKDKPYKNLFSVT